MAAPININANLNLNTSSINASAKQVQQALGRITGQASEFQKSLDASTARVFAFGATTSIINGINQSFKKLISTTITVQAKLTEINSILGAGASEFNNYRNSIFKVAKSTGQSFQTVADGAAELARQGLGATESAKRLEAALVLTRISGLGAQQSVKALTAAMNGFTSAGLTAEQVINKIVAVDTAFAVSAQDLADGFSRAGSTAEDAGVSFEELLGLITAVEQRTARGGAVIGNAFKSIFTRLSRGSTIEDLKALGVEINANQSGVQKLQALSKALEQVADPNVASQIKELAGGVFQINVVSAALKDLGSDASIFARATQTGLNATNEATKKNTELNKTLLAQINSLTASITSFAEKLGSITFGPLLENLVSLATKLSEGLDNALDPEKGNKFIQGIFKVIGGFISGPGLAIFTIAFAKIFKTVIKFAKEGFKSVMEIGSATERIKQIEGGLIGLLQKDANLRNTLLSTTATQAQKEQAVVSAIQRENQLLAQQLDLVTNISSIARQRGVTGFDSSTGSFKGKRGRRYAAGGEGQMEPNLMTAMMNEARDAPAGAVPYVTNFRGSPAVMNTSEMQVRINGREEILREDQIPRFNRGTGQGKRGIISKGKYAFLVPKVGASGALPASQIGNQKFQGGATVRGPQKNAIKGASDSEEANLEGQVKKSLFSSAAKWTKKLKPLGRQASVKDVQRGFQSIAGAKGALKSAVGSAFEVGITKSLDYNAAQREKGGDFDVRGGQNIGRIQKLFGIKETIADFKASQSSGNIKSFYSKVGKEKAAGAITKKENENVARQRAIERDRRKNPQFYTKKGELKRGSSELDRSQRIAGSLKYFRGVQRGKNFAKGTISNARLAARTGIRRFAGGSQSKSPANIQAIGEARQKIILDTSQVQKEIQKINKEFVKASKSAGKSSEGIKRASLQKADALKKLGDIYKINTKTIIAAASAERKRDSALTRSAKSVGGKAMGAIKASGGLGVGFALSAIGTGIESLGKDEEGNDKDTGLGKTARVLGKTASFAATGAMFGGPIGAAVGGAIGLGLGLFEESKKTDEREAARRDKANMLDSRREISKRAQSKLSEFGNIDQQSAQLKNLSFRTGDTSLDISSELKRAKEQLDRSAESGEGFYEAQKAYTAVSNKVAKLLGDKDGIQALYEEGVKIKSELKSLMSENAGATLKKQLSQGQDEVDTRSALLNQMVGSDPASQARIEELKRKNQIDNQILKTTGAKANQLDLQAKLSGTTNPAERAEISKQLQEAGKAFNASVRQSANFLVSKQMEISRLLEQGAKERINLERNVLTGAFADITKSVREGPMDLDAVAQYGDDFKAAKTDDERREIMASFNTNVLSKFGGNEKMQDFLSQIAGFKANSETDKSNMVTSKEEIERIRREGASIGQTRSDRDRYASLSQGGVANEALSAFNDRMAALQAEFDSVSGSIAKFSTDFNAGPVVKSVQATAIKLNQFAYNTGKVPEASKKLVDISKRAVELAGIAEKSIEKQEIKLQELTSRLEKVELDKNKITRNLGGED